MARTVGEVKFLVDFDGKGLPARTEALGDEMGDAAGKRFNKRFSEHLTELGKDMRKEMQDEGRASGEEYGTSYNKALRDVIVRNKSKNADILANVFGTKEGFAQFAKDFEEPQSAIDSLRAKMHELRNEGGLTDVEFGKMDKDLRGLKRSFNETDVEAERVRQEMADLGRQIRTELINSLEEAGPAVNRFQRNLADFRSSFSGLGSYFRRNRILDPAPLIHDEQEITRSFSRIRGLVRNPLFEATRSGVSRLSNTIRADGLTALRDLGNRFKTLLGPVGAATAGVFGFIRVLGGLGRGGNGGGGVGAIGVIGLLIALFIGLADSIATLGSVAGSSLAVFGAGTLALGVGVAVAVAGIRGMNGNLAKVAPAARPAAEALKTLRGSFKEIKKEIQGTIFAGLQGDIQRLNSKLIPVLSKGLHGIALDVHGFFDSMIKGLTSAKGLSTILALLDGFKPVLRLLGDSVLQLSAAFGTIFVAALPSLKTFSGFLDQTFGHFNKYLANTDGQKALGTFFGHLNTLAGPLINLLASAGKAVAGMVTPDAVKRLSDFLATMSATFPGITDMINILGDLNPIGLIADALYQLSKAFTNNKGPLKDFAKAAHDVIDSGIKTLGPIISDVVKALAPTATTLIKGIGATFSALIPTIKEMVKYLPDAIKPINDLIPLLPKMLKGFADFVNTMVKMRPLFKAVGDIIKIIVDLLTALTSTNSKDANKALTKLGKDIGDLVVNLFIGFSNLFDTLGKDLNGLIGRTLDSAFAPAKDWMKSVYDALSSFNDNVGRTIRDGSKSAGDAITSFNNTVSTGLNKFNDDTGKTIRDGAAAAGKAISDFFTGLVKAGTDFITKGGLKKLGKDIIDGIVSGLVGSDNVKGFESAVQKVGNQIVKAFQNFFGIHSPSTLMRDKVGVWIIKGILSAFTGAGDLLGSALKSLLSLVEHVPGMILGFFHGIGGKIGGFFRQASPIVATVAGSIVGFFISVPARIGAFLASIPGVFSRIFHAAEPLVRGVRDTISNLWQLVPSSIRGFLAGVGTTIGNSFRGAIGIVSSVVNSIVSFFSGLPGRILKAISGIAGRVGAALHFVASISGVDNVISSLTNIATKIAGLNNTPVKNVAPGAPGATVGIGKTAIGGLFNGAQTRIIGEAGPEAVVPLNRPLSQVDPSVRGLSAIAQGLASVGAGSGKRINVAQGAIVIQNSSPDPSQAASQIMDRLVGLLN